MFYCTDKSELSDEPTDKQYPTYEKIWKDPDLGYFINATHENTKFSNNLLEKFHAATRMHFSSKASFRKAFITEKARQWNIHKKKQKIEKSLKFWKSDNPAAIGKRLDKGFIPKPNDSHVLENVKGRLTGIRNEIDFLVKDIKAHDDKLFDEKGINLKLNWTQFCHESNKVVLEELQSIHCSIVQLEGECQIAVEHFQRICGSAKKFNHSSSSAIKKHKAKNAKKNEKVVRKRFEKNVEMLLNHICTKEAREYTDHGFYIPDYEIKVSREQPIHITKSKLKHLVHILDLFSHQARCTILDLVPDELNKDLLCALEKDENTVSEVLESVSEESVSEDEENEMGM